MVPLTRLKGGAVHLNVDLIATIEEHHDTGVTLVDGKTYVLQDSAEDVVDAVRDYRASILVAAERLSVTEGEPAPSRTRPDAPRLVVLRSDGTLPVGPDADEER